jgi:outer membrane receptor for Fe3+-dicitrate
MPPKDMIEINYMYLKGNGWKTKTKIIEESELDNYLNNKEYRVLKYKNIKC